MKSLANIVKYILLSIIISGGGLSLFYWIDSNSKNNLNHLFFSIILFFGIFLLAIFTLVLFVLYLAKRYYNQFASILVFISLITWEGTVVVGYGIKNFFQTEMPLIGLGSIMIMAILLIMHANRAKPNSKAVY